MEGGLPGHLFYRNCITAVVIRERPTRARNVRQGRQRFIDNLQPDERSVFETALVSGAGPLIDLVHWWNDLCGKIRAQIGLDCMVQARDAEMLTIKLELTRLNAAGVDKEPEWPGLDNNYAGYDVLSWRVTGNYLQPLLIEVKSTTASPLRFKVTRNEWKTAVNAGDRYIFHIWDMTKSPEVLYTKTVAEVRVHIPVNQEKGQWDIAEIPLV